MADFGKAFAHGILGMFGLGSLYDPQGDLQSQLSSAKDKQQSVINKATILAFQNQDKVNQTFYADIAAQDNALRSSIQLSDEMIREGLAKTNFFITALSVMVLILTIFMLAMKKCC